MVLNRDKILETQDIRTEEVSVPEWGGTVIVRSLMIAEGEAIGFAIREARKRGEDPGSYSARLVAASVVDENGARVFTDGDVVPLGRKSAAAMQRIAEKIQEISGIGPAAVEEAVKK